MENNSEINVGRWVEDRLASLSPPVGWQPDTVTGLQRFRHGCEARITWSRTWVWAGVTVTALCVCALAFPATRVFAQNCVNACLAETGLAGKFLWNGAATVTYRASGGATASSTRKLASDFTLPDVSGNSVRLSAFRGQVVMLNFWATWCTPCNVEIPWFVEFQRIYGDAGFVVLGVSLDDDGWRSVKPYLDEKGVNYQVVVGDDEIARSYGGVESLPTTFLIDRAGRIATMHEGLVEKQTYEKDIQDLIKEN